MDVIIPFGLVFGICVCITGCLGTAERCLVGNGYVVCAYGCCGDQCCLTPAPTTAYISQPFYTAAPTTESTEDFTDSSTFTILLVVGPLVLVLLISGIAVGLCIHHTTKLRATRISSVQTGTPWMLQPSNTAYYGHQATNPVPGQFTYSQHYV